MNNNITPFKVLRWGINSNKVEYYDIMPYLINKYKGLKKLKRPQSFEEFKKFVNDESKYQFWSRCEYEIIISDFPSERSKTKIDGYDQIEMNIDIITNLLMEQCK